jgi:uncharacterized 2Fe-2S/4Fe-4S cluster protein (DUF4445 family)
MSRVRFEPSGITVESNSDGEHLSDILERAGISLEKVCGGRGKCGRCRIVVRDGSVPVTDKDKELIPQEDLAQGMRLACGIRVHSDMVLEIPKESERNEQVILEDAYVQTKLSPVVSNFILKVPAPSLHYQVGDLERLRTVSSQRLRVEIRMPLGTLRKLPNLLSASEQIRLVSRGGEILDVTSANGNEMFGVAVDIGTTTVVVYLMDLVGGECVAVESKMNPQITHGDDVISRITFAMRNPDGTTILQTQISQCIDELIRECCASAGVDKEKVYEIVAVGNTAMHHLFFGLDTSHLGRSPFVPVVADAVEVKSHELGINIGEEAYVYTLPNVAGFVGADHIGVLLACRLWESDETRMAIDIGTNGEISVGNTSGVASTSCAAGPALEGANIRFGMRAATGAIDHLSIADDFEVSYTTISKGKPRGLCGSAVVDAISELFRVGVIDPNGRIRKELVSPRIRIVNGESQFVIAIEQETATGEAVTITQKDVSEVQCAKAAMYAGATILMEDRGVTQDDLDLILLAGAFGNYISPKSAIGLGIFPEVPLSKVKQIGNAAGSGAKIALLNQKARDEATKLAREIRFVELAARPEFQERFFQALYIPHQNQSLFPEVMSKVVESNKVDRLA